MWRIPRDGLLSLKQDFASFNGKYDRVCYCLANGRNYFWGCGERTNIAFAGASYMCFPRERKCSFQMKTKRRCPDVDHTQLPMLSQEKSSSQTPKIYDFS
jgi:hypothetical protein